MPFPACTASFRNYATELCNRERLTANLAFGLITSGGVLVLRRQPTTREATKQEEMRKNKLVRKSSTPNRILPT